MTYVITRDELIAMEPCGDKLKRFGDAESMNVRQAFDAGFTVSDILWVAGRLRLIDQIVVFANGCAAAAAAAADAWYAAAAAAAADAAAADAARYAAAAADAARYAAAAAAAAAADAARYAAAAAAAAARSAADAEIARQKQHLIALFSEEAAQ